MSIYTRTFILLLCLTIALLSVAVPLFSQQSIPVKQETILTFTHDFLQIFYPEFFDKNHRLSLGITAPADDPWLEMGGVYFAITEEKVIPLEKLVNSHPQTTDHIILGGSIWLPPLEYGRVQELHSHSDAVHEQQLRTLRGLLQKHPGWSNAQIASALKEAGAHFGPHDQEAFVNSLPLGKAERFLGKLKITSVEFAYPQHGSSGRPAAVGLIWIVNADAELPDGTHPRYVFTFEPFEGKLTDLVQSLGR